jgi:hypothetical protein
MIRHVRRHVKTRLVINLLEKNSGFVQEVGAARFRLIGMNFYEDPAGGAVDGDEQITSLCFVRYLRQLLDIYVQEARFAIFECFADRRVVAFLGNQFAQAGDAMTTQAAAQARARDCRIDELLCHGEQVIGGQHECGAQRHHDGFLFRCERGVHLVCSVRAVFSAVAVRPFAYRQTAQVATRRLSSGINSCCASVEFLISSRIRWVVRAWLCRD